MVRTINPRLPPRSPFQGLRRLSFRDRRRLLRGGAGRGRRTFRARSILQSLQGMAVRQRPAAFVDDGHV